VSAVLEIRNLTARFRMAGATVEAVRGLDLDIGEGEVLGLIGESGSGKTVTGLSILRLLPAHAEVTADRPVLSDDLREGRAHRGVVINIQRGEMDGKLFLRRDFADLRAAREIAHGGHDGMARASERNSRREPDPAVRSGDQRQRHGALLRSAAERRRGSLTGAQGLRGQMRRDRHDAVSFA